MLKKLLSGLFSAGEGDANSREKAAEAVEYAGYLIISEPDMQGGQYRVSGVIQQRLDQGELREHRFERSDMLPSRDACDEMMITKAKRYIEEVGDAMFEPDPRHQAAGDSSV